MAFLEEQLDESQYSILARGTLIFFPRIPRELCKDKNKKKYPSTSALGELTCINLKRGVYESSLMFKYYSAQSSCICESVSSLMDAGELSDKYFMRNEHCTSVFHILS